jgi:hypothetical protein
VATTVATMAIVAMIATPDTTRAVMVIGTIVAGPGTTSPAGT